VKLTGAWRLELILLNSLTLDRRFIRVGVEYKYPLNLNFPPEEGDV